MKSRTTSTQIRLDAYFKVTTTSPATKRKPEESKENDKKKKAKGSGLSKRFR
jgi:hypothetical protein